MQEPASKRPRSPLPRTRVIKGPLVRPLPLLLRRRLGAHPQGDVPGLHRLPRHTRQLLVERVQVRASVAALGRHVHLHDNLQNTNLMEEV